MAAPERRPYYTFGGRITSLMSTQSCSGVLALTEGGLARRNDLTAHDQIKSLTQKGFPAWAVISFFGAKTLPQPSIVRDRTKGISFANTYSHIRMQVATSLAWVICCVICCNICPPCDFFCAPVNTNSTTTEKKREGQRILHMWVAASQFTFTSTPLIQHATVPIPYTYTASL